MSKTKPSTSTSAFAIDPQLSVVCQALPRNAAAEPAEVPVNHIVVIDCSGSMYGELPEIRKHLKAKLPKLLRERDTLSIIWFSGRGEFGALLEGEAIPTLKDLKDVNTAIDRWLKPIGLTGFKEPLIEAGKLIDRVKKAGPKDAVFSLFFMSDGCDNQWPRADILKTVEATAGKLASSTFVEYGYYADRPLLAAMAAKAGGQHIFAEDFVKYQPLFEKAVSAQVLGGKRVEVVIAGDPLLGLAWAFNTDGDLLTFEVEAGKILVPEDITDVAFLSPAKATETIAAIGKNGATSAQASLALQHSYAAMSLLAVRMKPEIVYPILKALGDVAFIEAFSTCFGKQKYSEFMDAAKAAALDPAKRFTKGWDPTKVPNDDAFTVLDLLSVLCDDEGAHVLLDHDEFQYSRISRAREDAPGTALKFVADPAPDGYPLTSLTYNEDRPNISLLVRKAGKVDISEIKPKEHTKLPAVIDTFVFRNYAIVRDGLVNIAKLPVTISKETFEKLTKAGVEMTNTGVWTDKKTMRVVINVKPLPIINRTMVKKTSALTLLELEYQLTQQRCRQKVYKDLAKTTAVPKSPGFAFAYGDEATAWLKEQGITETSGFGPKQVQAPSTDFYVGKALEVSLKGYATLPSVAVVRGKMTPAAAPAPGAKTKAKKTTALTGTTAMMAEALTEADAFLGANPEKLHAKWLKGQADVAVATVRGLIEKAARIKFSVVVGQTWFNEFSTLDEKTIKAQIDGLDLECEFDLKEVEIKI